MRINGLLPIGSVVLLKKSTKRVMIMGVCQASKDGNDLKIYDYSGVLFPEGYQNPNSTFLFNMSQIDRIYFIGCQDEESLNFKERADASLASIRRSEQGVSEEDEEEDEEE